MATYALTLHGISENPPLMITIEADDENQKELEFLTSFSEILDSAYKLQSKYSKAGYHWGVGDVSGVEPEIIKEKFYEKIGRFLEPKLELISSEDPKEEQE